MRGKVLMQNMDTVSLREDDHAPKTVLLVEDDPQITEVVAFLLSEETPSHVLSLTNAEDAITLMHDAIVHLFLFDYHLVGSMNGIALYDSLHQIPRFGQIPVLLLSATLPEQELVRRNILGIHKPFDLDVLLGRIVWLLGKEGSSF